MDDELRRLAVEQAYRDHVDDVFRVAYSVLRDADAASDATQDAFARAWERWDQYDRQRPLLPWLHAIVARVALDALRRRVRWTVPALTEPTSEGAPVPRSRPDDGDPGRIVLGRRAVEAALDGLRPQARATVVLRHVYGYDYAEIASILGTSAGNVGSILSRAHAALRSSFAADAEREAGSAGCGRRAAR